MVFNPDNPEDAIRKLRDWAKQAINFRDGFPLPATINREGIDLLFAQLDFLGARPLYGLHFGLCAMAKEELDEDQYEETFRILDQSIRQFQSYPRARDWQLLSLIVCGLQKDIRTVEWLWPDAGHAGPELIRAVLPSRNRDLITVLADRALAAGQGDLFLVILRNIVRYDRSGLAGELLEKLPESEKDDDLLTDLIRFGLAENDPELSRQLLATIKDDYYFRLAEAAIQRDRSDVQSDEESNIDLESINDINHRCRAYLNRIREARKRGSQSGERERWLTKVRDLLTQSKEGDAYLEENRRVELEKDFLIESWACHGCVDLTDFENRMLERFASAKDDPEFEYFEVEEIMGDLCEVWAATGHYEKLFEQLDHLTRKGSLYYVIGGLLEHWVPQRDVPRIIEFCPPEPEGWDEDTEGFYPASEMEYILNELVFHLGKIEEYELANQVADHVRDAFGEDQGHDILATWYLWRGDYLSARKHGGGSHYTMRCPDELKKEFRAGTNDDAEAREYCLSLRDWENLPEILIRLSLHGDSRSAVYHLVRKEIQARLPKWLYDEYYDNDPRYPRNYPALRQVAGEAARESKGVRSRSEHRSPVEFRLLRASILFLCGVINLMIHGKWRGEDKERPPVERGNAAKAEKCRQTAAKTLSRAQAEPDLGRRIALLRDATGQLRYVDRLFSDRYVEYPKLEEAIRAEFASVREASASLEDYEAGRHWETLAKALLEIRDIPGVAEACAEWRECMIMNPEFTEDLVKKCGPEDWPLAAPFCGCNPLSALILAAKLEG